MRDGVDREALLELVAAYAMGILPAAEQAHVTAFILSDAEARREYEELRGTADLIGLTAEEPVDSSRTARMKERLLATVRSGAATTHSPSAATRASWLWGAGLATAAAVVFALVSVIENFGLRSDLAEMQRRVATLQAETTVQHRAVELDDRMLADLTSPAALRYTVPYGTVVKSGSHVYLALSSLPPVPRGKVYQAWTLARGATAMTPNVTFRPSSSGVTLVPIPGDASRFAAVAVSVEPAGGSRAPTTKPAFVQPLS